MTDRTHGAEIELRRLRDELRSAPAEQLPDLLTRAAALAGTSEEAAPLATARATDALYSALDAVLRLGDVPLPPNAPDALRELADRFRDRWVTAATFGEIEQALGVYTASVRGAHQERAAARTAVAAAADHLAVLDRLLATLDTISPPPVGAPGRVR